MTITSPCVGLCKYDETTGYCLGCARTEDEIAGWGMTSEARRAAVWEALPARFETLGVACRRLPWTTEDIRGFVVERLRSGTGTWVAGVVGAVAEFSAGPDARVEVDVQGDTIVARTPGGGVRFVIDDHVRALTFEPGDVRLDRSRIVLAVKRERGRLDIADALTDLGQDMGALDPTARAAHLFDLGLGRKEARFCVRVRPGPSEAAMRSALGSALHESLPKIGPMLLAESPVRVVETVLGRIEVSTPIPPPGGTSPAGPHTHLLPDHLATGRALPAGFDLPRAYLPGAMFYPAG
ncbi:MAG: DUF1289 domain-containing protein [Pseudomonadota bacterium]